jgi:hypothetical protein
MLRVADERLVGLKGNIDAALSAATAASAPGEVLRSSPRELQHGKLDVLIEGVELASAARPAAIHQITS